MFFMNILGSAVPDLTGFLSSNTVMY